MKEIEYEKYFDGNKYINPKCLIKILEYNLNKSFEEIKNEVNNSKVNLTEKEIKKYLNSIFIEEHPDESEREQYFDMSNDYDSIFIASINFRNRLRMERYKYEPYTLEYFNKYITIVRNKTILLLDIIDKISNNDTTSIKDILNKIDIKLDEKGNILDQDVLRLINPTIYNINELKSKVLVANNLETYLNYKLTLDSVYKSGCMEKELYPLTSIQVNNLNNDSINGNIKLSYNQIKQLEQEEEERLSKILKMF